MDVDLAERVIKVERAWDPVAACLVGLVDGGGVVDDIMVSGRAWPEHPEWMRQFVRLLREHASAEPAAASAAG